MLISLDSDFIDVPVRPKSSEPILLPQFLEDDSQDKIETSADQSSEFIELDNDEDESSNNSTAIEDIKTFVSHDHDLPYVNESLDQLQTELVGDIATQLTTVREKERLTLTLTDTMHEDTKVRKTIINYWFDRIFLC